MTPEEKATIFRQKKRLYKRQYRLTHPEQNAGYRNTQEFKEKEKLRMKRVNQYLKNKRYIDKFFILPHFFNNV